jgi:hypothetical protein
VKHIKTALFNQRGVAITMVMTSIALLAFLLANFTFETKLNKLRIYNEQDKLQARLNAEAGLKFALAKLKLYQEGRNTIEKNESIKKQFSPLLLENIITQPFIYPISEGLLKGANQIQKKAIEDFMKNVLLEGKLTVMMSSVSGFLNPNNLRFVPRDNKNQNNQTTSSFSNNQNRKNEPAHVTIEKEFVETLRRELDRKREEDDEFNAQYSNLRPELLIKELKFFVNHPEHFTDSERGEIEALYVDSGTTPKHAPMTSIKEMYLLEGWDDAIVELIIDRLTVHAVKIIPVNQITDSQLRILFPDITPFQIEEFFRYRDGNPQEELEPHEFQTVEQFKQIVVNRLGIVSDSVYNERIKEFENAGIKIGVAGKLFKVICKGESGRATYTLTAFVDLPVEPQPAPKTPRDQNANNSNDQSNTASDREEEQQENNNPNNNSNNQNQNKPRPMQLMEPRVVELFVGE